MWSFSLVCSQKYHLKEQETSPSVSWRRIDRPLVKEVQTSKDISSGGGHRSQLCWAKFILFLEKEVHTRKKLGQDKGQIRSNKGTVHVGSRSWMNLEAKSFKSSSPKKQKQPLPVPILWKNNFSLENGKEWFLHFEISQTIRINNFYFASWIQFVLVFQYNF